LVEIKAPMGGKVIKVSVKVGDQVAEDDEVVVLEAMKMEMPILSEEDGTVARSRWSRARPWRRNRSWWCWNSLGGGVPAGRETAGLRVASSLPGLRRCGPRSPFGVR